MSFLNTQLSNDVSARFQKLMAEDIYQRNKTTGEFERVGSGGGGEVELPSWVQSNAANFDNSIKNTKIDLEGVEVNNGNKGSFLSEDKLIFGEGDTNVELDKETIITANKLRDIVSDSENFPDKMLLYDPISKDFSYKNQLTLPSYAKTSTIDFNTGLLDGTSYKIRNDSLNILSIMTPYSFSIGASQPGTYSFDSSKTRAVLSATNLTFHTQGLTAILDYNRVSTLTKIHTSADDNASENARMLVYEPGTQTFKKSPIPSGSGGSLPAYIKPEIIEFSTEFQNHKISFNETTIVDKTSKNITQMSSGQLDIGKSNAANTTIDPSQPYVSIDSSGKISFFNDNFASTYLDYDKVKSLEQIKNPKSYFFVIPVYSNGTNHVDVSSYFPRWATLYPNGPFWSGTPPTQRKFKLPIGDTIIFKSNVGMNGTSPSLYYDTWYCVAFSPNSSFVHPDITFNAMSIEGHILETSFPYGIPADSVQNSIDIRLAPSPANDGSIAFRINGTYAKVDNNITSYVRKEPKDPFFGKISFTAKAYGGQNDIEEATLL